MMLSISEQIELTRIQKEIDDHVREQRSTNKES